MDVDIKNALLSIPFCQSLTGGELELLVSHSSLLSFRPDEIIIKQGRKSKGMYLILSGEVRVTARILGEGISHIALLKPGSFLGEISVLEKGPSPSSSTAHTDVFCLFIPTPYFDMLTLFFPKTKYKIIRAITRNVCDRLIDLHNKITLFIAKTNITTRSLFGEVIRTFTKPSSVEFDDVGIDVSKLHQEQLFEIFTAEEFNILLSHCTLIEAAKDCGLIPQGTYNTDCYLVLYGAVRVSLIQNNKVVKVSVLGPLHFFSSISSIDTKLPSIVDYTSCERVILLKISEHELKLMQEKNHELWYKIFELICKSFVELERAAEKLDVRLNSEYYNR